MSTRVVSVFGLVALTFAACVLVALPAVADSQARIVRLSDVHGSVQIDKNTGLGFENAFLNLPITQGTQLKTLTDGRVEVEFEDGSSLRLTPNSMIRFSTLGLSDSGQRISVIELVEGMAYMNWLGKDEVTLNFSREKISLNRAAHFRLDTSAEASNVAVFKGDVEVEGPAGKLVVEKRKTATFDPANDDKSTVVAKIVEGPFDTWDKEASAYHDQYAKNANSSPYGYGLSDMNYYGSYTSVPGYGMMWQPFFTGIGWDPFMNGAWGWYPGYGYMFASAYPWGWLPYRYGNWMFVPGFGWMWQPGGWSSWLTVPHYTATNLSAVHPPIPPTSVGKTVLVGKAPPSSGSGSPFRTVVRTGSAGMGIARGSIGNLSHLNHEVAKSGFAEVHPAPQFGAVSGSRSSGYSSAEHSTASAPSVHSSPSSGGHVSSPHH